jgi:hypothetical protein
MYETLLVLHSLLRWLVLIAGLGAVIQSWAGWLGGRSFSGVARSLGLFFVIGLDMQFLVGFVLYLFASPFTRAAFSDFGAAMRDPALRFFAVEHVVMAVLAIALAHIGHRRAKRPVSDLARHRTRAIFFTIALVILLVAIPWPGRTMGRPLFRF